MESIRILHISDIQEGVFGIKPDLDYDDSKYNSFLNDLEVVFKEIHLHNPIDIIIISGDLVSTGNLTEFEDLTNQFISKLKDIFKSVPNDKWIVVPGNHDVEWGKAKRDLTIS